MASRDQLVSEEQRSTFNRDGFLILKGFYDAKEEIEPIHRDIYRIIGLLLKKYGIEAEREPFSSETFDSGFQQLIASNRSYGAEVYDACKQIPAFLRLVAGVKHEQLVRELRGTDFPGVADRSQGIRIDNPQEDMFRAYWHQDYLSHLRSQDGLVFWSPLLKITQPLGPVIVAVGSHTEGVFPIHMFDPRRPNAKESYVMSLHKEEEVAQRYRHVAPLTEPGDLIVLDFLTLHCSGVNASTRSRWSMQMRWFNFLNPVGLSYSWKGSFAAGVKLRDIHPELLLDEAHR